MATPPFAQLRCLQCVAIKTGAVRGDLDQRQSAAACDEYASTTRAGKDQGRSRLFTSFLLNRTTCNEKRMTGTL
jgi:hypothetical protein